MKRIAIIPVAGTGTHLRPHTHTQPKPLIPIAGKPILAHIVDGWRAEGLTEFVFVIGYLGTKIKTYIEDTYTGRITYHFVEQEPRLGLGHAIALCQDYLMAADEVVIALGDAIIEARMQDLLHHTGNVTLVQPVEHPELFGVVQVDDSGKVLALAEKPRIPLSNLALVGVYKIGQPQLLAQALKHILQQPTPSGNYSLTDALHFMIAQLGARLDTQSVQYWHDCGHKDTLLETNRILLERNHTAAVYSLPGSVIIPPVYISPTAVIENSIIGPHVAVDEHSVIRNAIVEDSILGAYSRLDSIVLKGSIIGNDASITGSWHSINIGDNTELNLRN